MNLIVNEAAIIEANAGPNTLHLPPRVADILQHNFPDSFTFGDLEPFETSDGNNIERVTLLDVRQDHIQALEDHLKGTNPLGQKYTFVRAISAFGFVLLLFPFVHLTRLTQNFALASPHVPHNKNSTGLLEDPSSQVWDPGSALSQMHTTRSQMERSDPTFLDTHFSTRRLLTLDNGPTCAPGCCNVTNYDQLKATIEILKCEDIVLEADIDFLDAAAIHITSNFTIWGSMSSFNNEDGSAGSPFRLYSSSTIQCEWHPQTFQFVDVGVREPFFFAEAENGEQTKMPRI